jgi:hypothetical protein
MPMLLKAMVLSTVVYFVDMVEIVSDTIRVSKETKEALLRVAARLQERTGKRVDFDEAIAHLVKADDKSPESFLRFVGSVEGFTSAGLQEELQRERRLDERRSKRKYGV